MKQRKISNWLKGIVIVLAILGALYLVGITLGVFCEELPIPVSPFRGLIYFTWYTLFICYIILFLFWNVCTQIGKGNSFSPENAASFHKIALCGVAITIGFFAEFIWAYFTDYLTIWLGMFSGIKIVIFGVFIVLCEALSKLILHAYEIRQENELTI